MSDGIGPGPACPLCRSTPVRPFARAHGRRYLDCEACGLIHVAPEDRPTAEAERAHYATHVNDPADAGYRAWLGRVAEPLIARLPEGARGLDYGSGPGPTLSRMLEERGFAMEVYDPIFAPDAGVLGRAYDFVTCTETAEHFFSPADEFERLDAILRPGGWLAVMTEMVTAETAGDAEAFAGWRYARDPTHVSFYRPRTMAWIAARHGWTLEMVGRNVALFHKPR